MSVFLCSERGLLLAAVPGLLTAVVSLVVSMGSRHVAFTYLASVGVAGVHKSKGSEVVAHGLSCAARGIFPDQGSIPRPLHWQVDS